MREREKEGMFSCIPMRRNKRRHFFCFQTPTKKCHCSAFLDYTPAFSCLAFAKKAHTDIFGNNIRDARCHLATCLQTLTASHPNQVRYFPLVLLRQ